MKPTVVAEITNKVVKYRCVKCNTEVVMGANYCHNCGYKLDIRGKR
jgi:ribosomal protein L40E